MSQQSSNVQQKYLCNFCMFGGLESCSISKFTIWIWIVQAQLCDCQVLQSSPNIWSCSSNCNFDNIDINTIVQKGSSPHRLFRTRQCLERLPSADRDVGQLFQHGPIIDSLSIASEPHSAQLRQAFQEGCHGGPSILADKAGGFQLKILHTGRKASGQ